MESRINLEPLPTEFYLIFCVYSLNGILMEDESK